MADVHINPKQHSPPPPNQAEGGQACTFTLSPAPAPAYTVPTSGSGVYWFGDAIAMKRVAGAPQGLNDCGDYTCWDNVNSNALPHWAFFKALCLK